MLNSKRKLEHFICEFFRYLSFLLVISSLIAFISTLWFKWPDYEVFTKFAFTTFAVIIASIIIKVIFTEGREEENKKKSDLDA